MYVCMYVCMYVNAYETRSHIDHARPFVLRSLDTQTPIHADTHVRRPTNRLTIILHFLT